MINKLQAVNTKPTASACVEIKSDGNGANVMLSVRDAFQPDDRGKFAQVIGKKTQLIQFTRDDGESVQMRGVVLESDAVQCEGAHRVLVEVSLRAQLKAAREAGAVSGSYTQLQVIRILKVWLTDSEKPDFEATPVRGLKSTGIKSGASA